MKKIIIVLICIVLFLAGGFLCWRYFGDNFKDYYACAEFEPSKDAQLYFTDNGFVSESVDGIFVYSVNEEGGIDELYSESMTDKKVVYVNGNYTVLANDATVSVYSAENGWSLLFEVQGKFLSTHEFGEYLCLKLFDQMDNVTIYRYNSNEGVINITEKYDFDFVDYCIDSIKNKEYFISYVLMGEYVKINIMTCINGVVSPKSFIELDNTVYRDFDYVNNMFVFYTDTSMLFINTENQVRNIQYVYDIDKVEKLLYSDKIVYIMDGAYFNGISNVYIASASSVSYEKMTDYSNISKYSDKIVYKDGKYVKQYTFGSALLNDTVLFSDDAMTGINVMGNMIVVRQSDKIVFMKTNK